MDHKVSKDMISSGMIPSGEKTQADLGRTQYGSAPSPSKLMDAYKSMYEHHQKDKDGNTIPHEGEELNEGKIPAGLQAYLDKKKGKKEDKKDDKEMKESVEEKVIKIKKDLGESADLFDIISTYFIEEGYDKKDVYAAMSSIDLSEEVQDLHEVLPIIAKAGAMLGKLGAAAGKGLKAMKTGAGNLMSKIKPSGIKPTPSGTAKVTSSGGNVVQGSSDTGKNKVVDFLKREGEIKTRQELMKDRQVSGTNKTGTASAKTTDIAASADLFDIVKGQLLDEGLSEEEIKDIMLTLTPDEIMSEMAVNPNIKAMDAKNKADMIARAQANKVPDKVREASKRQMKAGTPREDKNNPYTTQDKKTIIDYNKNK